MKTRLSTLFLIIFIQAKFFCQTCDGYIKNHDSLFIEKTFSINASTDVIIIAGDKSYTNKMFLSRMDQFGNILWVKTLLNTSGSSNYFNCDGSFIYHIVDTSANGVHDAHLKKYNLNGNQIIDQAMPVNAAFYDLELDGSGNILLLGQALDTLVAGTFTLAPNTQTSTNIYEQEVILKYNASLNVVWAKFVYQVTTFVSNPNYGYNYLLIDKSNDEIYYLISASGLANYSINFGSSQILNSVGNSNILAKFNSSGTCLWATLGAFTPPVRDGWALQNGKVLVLGPPISVMPANLDIFSSATGSLLASFTKSITSNYFPHFLINSNAIYCVGSDLLYSRHFIEKYDHSFNLLTRRYFGNSLGSSYQIYTGASLVNNYIHFSSAAIKNEFIGPTLFHQQIPGNDSLCFYGKMGLDLNILNGNFIPATTTMLCGQSQQVVLTSNVNSPFDQNLVGINVSWSPTVGLSASNSFSAILSPTSSTQYVASISDASCTVKDTANIIVEAISAFNYTINNMIVSFSKQGNNCNSFIWDFGNGNTSTINSDPLVTYATPGTYGVCLQCSGLNACTKCINITVPGTGSGGVGIAEVEPDEFVNVFPNPGTGKFYLTSGTGQLLNYELIASDYLGNELIHVNIKGEKCLVDLSAYPKGMYVLQLRNDFGKTKVVKLVIY